jgi:hypothetical protein
MKHPLRKLIVVLISVLLFGTLVVNAQDTGTQLMNTISVVGTGTATGAPDMATINIGVERVNTDISSAYGEVNDAVGSVIQSLQDAGIAQEDIRTQNLNIFTEQMPTQENNNQVNYRVTNQVHVTVRDISQLDTIIDTAVNAGANSLYGLNMSLSDSAALEQTARTDALEQAQSRAQQIADHLGVQLGDVVMVSEGAFASPLGFETLETVARGGSGAVIEPGQLTVSVTLQVIYAINRSE